MKRLPKLATGIAVLAGLTAALPLGGCRGERSDAPPRQFLPDMDDQERWNPQSRSTFFADGRTMRPRVEGTVAFGRSQDPEDRSRTGFLRDDVEFYFGMGADGEPLAYMPASAVEVFRQPGEDTGAAMMRMIARGQERYNIYCAACHSYTGDGQGAVAARWSYPLPTYHDERYLDRGVATGTDGHFFDVIRNGLVDQTGAVKMPPYGHAINEADAWAVVAYVRTLQAAWVTDLGTIPAARRQELERARRLPVPPVPPGPRAVEPPGREPAPTDPPRQDPPRQQEPTPATPTVPEGNGQQQEAPEEGRP